MNKYYKPIDLSKIKTFSSANRKTKAQVSDFAQPSCKNSSFKNFYKILPNFLGAHKLKKVTESIIKSHKNKRPIILGMGAHVIKVGLSPLIIDLMKRGIINCLALNGAGAIHDYEIATLGRTSEEVAEGLKTGRFGMVKETLEIMNQAITQNSSNGFGAAIGSEILNMKAKYQNFSLLASAVKLHIPACVHIAIGTDTIHMTNKFNASATGEATFNDFKLLCSVVADLEGGVYLNIGSAVILPEVFLKALTVARNLGNNINKFTTINMDMLQHYRPTQNVLSRPGGTNFALTGHHEIMVPLLYQAILEGI